MMPMDYSKERGVAHLRSVAQALDDENRRLREERSEFEARLAVAIAAELDAREARQAAEAEAAELAELIALEARKVVLERVLRVKYQCPCCNTGVVTAPGPVKLIPGERYALSFTI